MATQTELQIKQDIEKALRDFETGSLVNRAIALFNVLGYQSNKRVDLGLTPQRFIQDLGQDKNIKPERVEAECWRSVDMIFQYSTDELKAGPMASMFDGYDKGLYNSFLFLTIELQPAEYSRTRLANITREVNKLFNMPVSVLFKNGNTLTLSIVTHRPNKKDNSKDVLEKVTLIKDIQYKKPHRAHLEILFDLELQQLRNNFQFNNFDQLQQAWKKTLDSSELNRRFFREIADWYFWASGQVVFPIEGEKNKEESKNLTEIRLQENANATGLIRLITRIIFVWFLKEKNLIPDEMFQENRMNKILNSLAPAETTFYKAILQNLFFATLNQEMGDARRFRRKGQNYNITNLYRYEDYFIQPEEALKLFMEIPFLNGGLFECLDKPAQDSTGSHPVRIDGFSDRPDNPLKVPNFLFFAGPQTVDLSGYYGTSVKRAVRGLINILESYKFTITENTPVEEEIALDPELLGKVFENLLAYYNPETQSTARKQTGSFYTPREIVNYMVDETLIAYLAEKLPGDPATEDKLRHLFAFNDQPHEFTLAQVATLIKTIDEVKILDPACGSGAFPMGALYRLVYILSRLDPQNALWEKRQIERVDELIRQAERTFEDTVVLENAVKNLEQQKEDIRQAFERNDLDYGRKLYLIENCIYGVDIQPVAVQISKLRCFISLIVDQKIFNNLPNRGVRPLPNLETKFVAANSLLGISRPQLSFADFEINQKEKELGEVRRKYFTARTPTTKQKYRDQDNKLRAEIAAILNINGYAAEVAQKLASWNPYDQNTHAEFFDPEWMFNITQGFDIVIGNPPYVRQEAIKEQKPLLAKALPEVYAGTADLYVYFYGRGFQALREGGHLAYISSNKFFLAGYGELLRSYFENHVHLKTVIDFAELPIFEAAAYTCILIGAKHSSASKNQLNTYHVKTLQAKKLLNFAEFKDFTISNITERLQSELSKEGWNIDNLSEIRLLEKLKLLGQSLREYTGGKFYRGITTGYNEAFVIDQVTYKRLVAEDPKSSKIIKPYLRGRDIKKYKAVSPNLYLLYISWSFPLEEYPAIKNHLVQHKKALEKRPEVMAGRFPWYAMSRYAADYYQEFDKPKLISLRWGLEGCFAYDTKGFMTNDACYIFSTDDKLIIALFNSSLINFFLKKQCPTMGSGYMQFFVEDLQKIPMPKIVTTQQQTAIEELVNKLVEKGSDLPEAALWQKEIDQIVYEIYGLTEEEIALVERK